MADKDEYKNGYLARVTELHEKLLDQATGIANRGPAISLQIVGIYLVVGATLARVLSSVKLGSFTVEFSTADLSVVLAAAAFLLFGGAYISMIEYKDKVRWYEHQLAITNETSKKAFEIVAEHAAPSKAPAPVVGAQPPTFGNDEKKRVT